MHYSSTIYSPKFDDAENESVEMHMQIESSFLWMSVHVVFVRAGCLLDQASVRTSTMKKHYADERRLLVSLLDFSQGFWPTCSWWPWESRLVKVEAQHTVDTLNDPRMLSTAPRWRFLVLLLLLDEDSVGYVFFSTNCDSVGYVGSGQANQSAWSLPFSNLAYRQFPSSMSMSIPATWGEIIY